MRGCGCYLSPPLRYAKESNRSSWALSLVSCHQHPNGVEHLYVQNMKVEN